MIALSLDQYPAIRIRNGEEIFADSYINLSRENVFDGTATVIYLRYRYKTKEDFYIPEAEFPSAQTTIAGSKQNFRIDLRHNFSPIFSIRVRFEKNFLSSGESGELFLFDASWSRGIISVTRGFALTAQIPTTLRFMKLKKIFRISDSIHCFMVMAHASWR